MIHTHRCITKGYIRINNFERIRVSPVVFLLWCSPVFLHVFPHVPVCLLTRSEDALHPELIQLVVVGGGDNTAAHHDNVFPALRLELGEKRGDQCTVPRRLGTHTHHVHLGKEGREKARMKGVRERRERGSISRGVLVLSGSAEMDGGNGAQRQSTPPHETHT